MSVALFILLPILLSGYIFASNANVFSYNIMRLEGYHLYFKSATYGTYFVFLSSVIVIVFHYQLTGSFLEPYISSIKDELNSTFSVTETPIFELILVSFISIVLSIKLVSICNFIFDEKFSHFLNIKNDDFELLLLRAMEKEDLVQVTMENGKVYVGFVIRGFKPKEERKHLRILPIYSGYRDDVGKVHHTTGYEIVTNALTNDVGDEDQRKEILIDFELILPVSEIKSAHIFRSDAWDAFTALEKKIQKSKAHS